MLKLNFKNISFKYKILWTILTVTLVILVFSMLIYIHYGKREFEKNTTRELELLSEIVSENCVAPVLFKDSAQAYLVLQSLSRHPHINISAITDTSCVPLAYFPKSYNIKNCPFIQSFFRKDTLIRTDTSYIKLKMIIDESENNKVLGCLLINRNLKDYQKRFDNILYTNLLITVILLLIAFLIAIYMQRIISQPILNLSFVVKKISENKDFSLRIEKRGNDEIGHLIDGFNEMLDTIEKQNTELIRSKDEAIKLAQAKQQFLANMSHEIRTPMNAIIGMINLLTTTRLTKEQKEYLNHIDLSANNLLVIINDILDVSKIESGKITFEQNRFNINDSLENIQKIFEPKILEKGLEFHVIKQPDVPAFWIGDQVRLNQILINLVGNAIKFTDKGKIIVELSCKQTLKEGIFEVLFKVEDTGIGIPKEFHPYIFDAFTQASNQSSRRYGGTGLGLTISKQLVELQGGKIWFESTVNKGTTFYFYLPLKKANPPSFAEISAKSHIEILDNIDKTIFESKLLIVEDNKVNQFLLKTILTKQRFTHLFFAENGKEAIEIIQKEPIDLILMDLHMPEMDGYETTSFIRNNLTIEKRQVPIIAITAAVVQGEKEKCMKYGMNAYVSKPFKPDELFTIIIQLLTRK